MSDHERRPSSLDDLERRKVVRVAAVYAATVFAVLQVADLLIEPLSLPGWTMRLLLLLGVVGFPVAVGLAWVFDVRPEGLVARSSTAWRWPSTRSETRTAP